MPYTLSMLRKLAVLLIFCMLAPYLGALPSDASAMPCHQTAGAGEDCCLTSTCDIAILKAITTCGALCATAVTLPQISAAGIAMLAAGSLPEPGQRRGNAWQFPPPVPPPRIL